MTTIKLKTIDEILEFTSSPPVYSGDVNTIAAQFEFDEFWEGFAKTAVFYRDIKQPYQVVLKDDICNIPSEVMLTEGRIYIGVFGVKEDKVKTSEVVYYDIGTGVMTFGTIPEPSEEIWQQILSELQSIRDLAQNMTDDQNQFIEEQTQKVQESVDNLNEVTQEVTQKLENGEFDGRTVLSGIGVPSNELGHNGDVYIDTNILNENGNFCFVKEDGVWVQKFKMNGKDGADTLPIGSTILWNEEEPPSSDIYEEVDIDVFNPRQLLVNNDFQVNQRGQSEYNFNIQGKYGLDMWQHRQGSYYQALIVTPIKGGGIHIKLGTGAGSGIRQYVSSDSSCVGKNYSYALEIDGVRYDGTCVLTDVADTKVINNDLFHLNINYDTSSSNIVYSLWFKRDVETYPTSEEHIISYCDLFEGNVIYPHQKEDYYIALMKCQRYVLTLITTNGYFGTASYYICDTRIQNMKTKPTCIVNSNVQIRLDGNSYTLNVSNAVVSSSMEEIILSVSNLDSFRDKVINRTVNGWVDEKMIISCEPL